MAACSRPMATHGYRRPFPALTSLASTTLVSPIGPASRRLRSHLCQAKLPLTVRRPSYDRRGERGKRRRFGMHTAPKPPCACRPSPTSVSAHCALFCGVCPRLSRRSLSAHKGVLLVTAWHRLLELWLWQWDRQGTKLAIDGLRPIMSPIQAALPRALYPSLEYKAQHPTIC